ncbi:hypothetical protein [Vibrio comitans]
MMMTKDNFENKVEQQSVEKPSHKDNTMPRFLVFFALLAGWCSVMVYSTLAG